MSLIKGIHHVSLKSCSDEQFEKAKKFYGEMLGIEEYKTWEEGVLYRAGAEIIEIYRDGKEQKETGSIYHYALATDDVDRCIELARNAGYEIIMEPEDCHVDTLPVETRCRVGFCRGPLGEEIEFFQEK